MLPVEVGGPTISRQMVDIDINSTNLRVNQDLLESYEIKPNYKKRPPSDVLPEDTIHK